MTESDVGYRSATGIGVYQVHYFISNKGCEPGMYSIKLFGTPAGKSQQKYETLLPENIALEVVGFLFNAREGEVNEHATPILQIMGMC